MTEKNKVNPKGLVTKQFICEALLEMLKTHAIHKISIKELCQIAGVNRSTFYNHYGSQYDVLNEIAETYIQRTSLIIKEEIGSGKSIYTCLTKVLQYIKDNLEFVKLLIDFEHHHLFSYITITLPKFDDMIIEHLPVNMDLEEKNAIASYVQHGTVRLLIEWVLSDCFISPEKEATLILSIAGRTIGT